MHPALHAMSFVRERSKNVFTGFPESNRTARGAVPVVALRRRHEPVRQLSFDLEGDFHTKRLAQAGQPRSGGYDESLGLICPGGCFNRDTAYTRRPCLDPFIEVQ